LESIIMLVLSRKQKQCIAFPNLGISIEILRVDGKTVRVGIEAPTEVRVLRGELVDHELLASVSKPQADADQRKRMHDLRNELNSANLALRLIQKQIEKGLIADAEQTLAIAFQSLTHLNELAQQPVLTRRSIQGSDATGKCRALVVEDNPNERELLAGFLELCGYQVDVVEDGEAAMAYLANAKPDMVLLDMQMPRMDGPATVAAIRANPEYRAIKLFVVSGSDQASLGVQVGEMGIDRWFAKPIKPGKFAQDLADEVKRPPAISA
jgi:carbon storage regulator CsrA